MTRALLAASGLLVAARMAAGSPNARAPEAEPAFQPRIEIPAVASEPRHPITLDEIVSRRVVQQPRLSPDGKSLVFLVRQGFRDRNAYQTALFLTNTDAGGASRKLLEEAALSSVEWSADGRSLAYLSVKSGSLQLWRIPAAGGAPEPVFAHAPGEDQTILRRGYNPGDKSEVGVLQYAFSPDGRRIAFTAPGRTDPEKRSQLDRLGVLYDDETMNLQNLWNRSWTKEPTGLWIYDVAAKSERRLREFADEVSHIAWSPDGRSLAVSYAAPPLQRESMIFFNQDLGVVSADDARWTPVAAEEAVETLPVWSPDGKSLAYVSLLDERTSIGIWKRSTGRRRDIAQGRIGQWVPGMWWTSAARLVLEVPSLGRERRGPSALYSVSVGNGAVAKLSSGDAGLSGCSISSGSPRAACIRESSAIPPDPAIVSLPDGAVRVAARVNPELESVALAPVTERRWKNRYGAETNGYLIRPAGDSSRPAPLLVILYGFTGEFVLEAEWISSYPAQAFARDGFAVLMLNYPRYENWTGRDYARGSVAEALSPLASIETAVDALVTEGVADRERVGILGWSYGCFLAEFAITHSDRFRVASVGDGGDYNPGVYWMIGRRANRENYERVLGGPPYGDTLRNWQEFSPAFNAHRVRAPVLMEFNPMEGLVGLEMFSALRRHDVPVEFVVYPEEGHIFTQPEHRFHSMQRNLDWFRFWLQGKERAQPETADQYSRWRKLRASAKRGPFPGSPGERSTPSSPAPEKSPS